MEIPIQNEDFSPRFHQHYWGINRGNSTLHGQTNFLPPILPYSINALEPILDSKGVKEHYLNYHMRCFENFLQLMAEENAEQYDIDYFLSHASHFSEELQFELGGWLNHQLFWNNLSPYGGVMSDALELAITQSFGDIYHFKLEFIKLAEEHNCCGWSWLVKNEKGKLEIINTEQNVHPLMDIFHKKGTPLLTIDMWEHAYVNKYKDDKALYLKSIWMLINWNEVSTRYETGPSRWKSPDHLQS